MIKNLITFSILLTASILFSSCAYIDHPDKLTDKQIQSMQTITLNVSTREAFDATEGTFKNMGYIINSSEFGNGFITAESVTERKLGIWGAPVSEKIRATAFFQNIKPDVTKVRLILLAHKEYGSYSGSTHFEDDPIIEPELYQNIFSKIQNKIRVRK